MFSGSLLALKDYQCEFCNKTYKQKRNLQKHLKYECGQQGQFTCSACDYRAKQKVHLKTHYYNRHYKKKTANN